MRGIPTPTGEHSHLEGLMNILAIQDKENS